MSRKKQIIQAIELLKKRKNEVIHEVMDERSYRTSVENLVIESVSKQERIQKKINRLEKELKKEEVV